VKFVLHRRMSWAGFVHCSIHCVNVCLFCSNIPSLQHGRVKTKMSTEDEEAKGKEREKKSKLYRVGIDKAFTKVLAYSSNYQ